MTWLPTVAPGATPLDRVFGLRPTAYARFRALYGTLWDGDVLDPVILELCRLRVGMLLGCEGETRLRHEKARAAGLDEASVAELGRWPASRRFTPAQRACLAFAERYVLDPHGITDDEFAALSAHLGPPALATLALAVAVFDALARFRLALGVAPAADGTLVVPGPGAEPASLP
jgi:alkylhydroperoxidase family enzyme